MLDRLERIVAAAPGYAELRLHRNVSRNLFMRRGSLLQNNSATLAGASARCHALGTFGFAALPDESDAALARVLAEARENADLIGRRAAYSDQPLPKTAPGEGVYDYRTKKARLGAGARIELLKRLDDYIRARYPDVINADLALGELSMEKALATSEGARTHCVSPRTVLVVTLSVAARGRDSEGPVQLSEVLGGFGEFEDRADAFASEAEGEIDRLHEDLRRKAEGVFPEAGMHDVVLDSDLAGILAHEAIGHTCEADLVLAGSIAGPRLGQQVASEKITLVDQAGLGHDGGAQVAIHVDDEGTPCRNVAIIEKGILKEFLNNKATALELDAVPTGNARAYTYADEPLVRMRNTAIMPGSDRLEDMIGAIEHGYYLKRSSNGQADLTSEFMFGVTCGYEIVGGKLGRAIRDTTISGVAFDVLQAVTHVGNEFTWSVGGFCGKKTIIPVSMGGPAIKTRLNIGGR
jgi:TldD protein